MNNPRQPKDVVADNENSLKALVRAIRLSQGQFRLILVRCNYAALRERMVQQLRELSPVQIRELVLPHSVKTLYTTIKAELGDEVPHVLMVFGLESVSDIRTVLTSSNYIREEFSKNFPFPLVLWINDEVQQKLLRLAPDLESWATSVEFALTTNELLDFLRLKTDELFASDLTPNLQDCFEIEAAWNDLQSLRQVLDPDLEASLEFLWGLEYLSKDQIDTALEHYQKSLAFWQQDSNGSRGARPCAPTSRLERQGILLLDIALCYYRKAEQNRAESQRYWEQARDYLQQCLDVVEQAQRLDLVTKHISKLGEVLRRLQAWEQLQVLAEKALTLHQGDSRQLAQDYGFFAEIALEQSNWNEAYELVQQALQILDRIPNLQPYEQGLYRFLLARSQRHLGQVQEAIRNLEQVRQNSEPQYNPEVYIKVLGELRSLYFEQGEYLAAFRIKQEQLQVEHQYGFRAFIGAGYLQPKRSSVNPAVGEVEQQGTIAQEIAVSSREQDVKRLIERISRNDCKLTVIHGQSGVGKSSILQGGLVPALHQQAIGERDVLPVLLRVYQDWVGALEMVLANATFLHSPGLPPQPPLLRGEQEGRLEPASHSPGLPPQPPLLRREQDSDSPLLVGEGLGVRSILQQLRNKGENNLLTVLIFDQFEEFFFVYTDQKKRQPFYEFLRVCLDIPFVKVIFSLREDYLHYLLECDRLLNLTVINNNILDKNIRYYLGNFSPDDATVVVRNLTEKSQFPLESGLVDALVRDLAGDVGEVRPIELQIVGAQLQTEKITTLEQYRQCGTKEKLVERFLEDVIKDCGSENERAARLVLYLLTNENGTRPLKTRAELAAELATEADKLDLVLEIVVRSGLVLLVPEKPENLYQLVHDYLVDFIRQQQGNELLAELQREREQRLLTEVRLESVEKANQILAEAKQQAEAILEKAIKDAQAAQDNLQQAEAALVEAREGTRLEREGVSALRQFEFTQLDALVSAMRAGKALHDRVKDGRPLENYPAISPLFALRTILSDIRERNKIQTQQDFVWSVSFSPDGKQLATAGDDGTVRLWNLTGQQVAQLKGHQGGVSSVSFSPDGKLLATAGDDGTVRLWNLTRQQVAELKGHQGGVNSVSFSPDGKLLATAGDYGTVRLWNLSGQQVAQLKGHQGGVSSVSFSPDGKQLATAGDDGTVRLWNLSGQQVAQLKGHQGGVSSVSFSPDGKLLATAGDDGTVRLWNLSGQQVAQLKGHQGNVRSVSFSPDGKQLATAGDDGTVRVWTLRGQQVAQLKGHQGGVSSVSFSPNGKLLATAGYDGTARVWTLSGQQVAQLKGHQGNVRSVSFSPNGKLLATAGRDGTARVWTLSGQQVAQLKGHQGNVRSVSFSPNGKLLATAGYDGTARVWTLRGQQVAQLKGHQGGVSSVSFSPDGKLQLIGQPTTDINSYQFTSPEVKQRAFRFDGLFLPIAESSELPIYFVEVQFQKKPKFYARLFAEIFLYFYQYDHNTEWYAIVIYRRRRIETPAPQQYRELMEHRVRRIYLDELGETAEQFIGVGIVQLVVESKRKTPEVARNLIEKARRELADAITQQQIIELIETVVLYKFPNLSREELEAMLGLSELRQTRVYQEALEEGREEGRAEGRQEGLEEGREEGREEGKLQAKLEMVSLLLELGLAPLEIAERLGLDIETVEAATREQS